MKGNAARFVRIAAGLLGLVTLGWVLTGQAAKPVPQGVPTDWTHRHVIFSQPATEEQVRLVEGDIRYSQQWFRHNAVRSLPQLPPGFGNITPSALGVNAMIGLSPTHPDWAKNLGNGASVGANVYPAKFAFQTTTFRCGNVANPDFVVFSTGLSGSGTQASLVAYDNLWSACGGTAPVVYWAYNTAGQIRTSPVFSQDGKQVAFVETNGGAASLVLLKWKASGTQTVTSPGLPSIVGPASYFACVAPCMTQIFLTDGTNTATDDITSSVFYDYSGDTAWVGDNHGWLHKFKTLFLGAPTEVRTAPWPVQVNPGSPTALASPVHDGSSGNVYVGDVGGFFYRVNDSTGAVIQSAQVDHGVGIVAGPILDVVARMVYVFASSDGSSACGGSPCSAVLQFPINFAAAAAGTKATVGTSANVNPNPLYDGAFDSTYEASINGTGNLYVCGNTGGVPTLYMVPITANTMLAPVAGPALASATTPCSPVSDVVNPNNAGGRTEWIFASAHTGGLTTLCAGGGCVMNSKDTPWVSNKVYSVGQEVIDSHFQIHAVRTAGTSRTGAPPNWSLVFGGTTTDNTVTWVNQGPPTFARPVWQTSHVYSVGNQVVDTSNNVQVVIVAGTSAASNHGWNANPSGNTADGTVLWRCVGANPVASLNAAGGTSGIIMDTTVAGHAYVYFSTQSNQVCGTTGTGGCAVQATQSALQ